MKFDAFFKRATGNFPYPYQTRFVECERLPELLSVPTGVGKTATAILGWLYRRRFAAKSVRDATPRRLAYCLPMRTLVEQTERSAQSWIEKLALAKDVGVHLLMGGVDHSDWDEWPERDAILIGTQDMLLSRALNRGYGMSRYRWPMHFGLLNNDCLWVMDETQLMGVGLTTTAQLNGFRQGLGTIGTVASLWMSATLDTGPLETVDNPKPEAGFQFLSLADADRADDRVRQRIESVKPIERTKISLTPDSEGKTYAKDLAAIVKTTHDSKHGLTLVVLNRVQRAQDVYEVLRKLYLKSDAKPELALIHARFRPYDRLRQEKVLFNQSVTPVDRVVVATQAIEAGVDVSSGTLFTELAPWSSLVQRFGRCNRYGECGRKSVPVADVYWIDIDTEEEKKAQVLALPYDPEQLQTSRRYLKKLKDVGPNSLAEVRHPSERPIVHTIRRKDLLDLWDTTPDLAGNDLDVSRFIRDSDDTDVQFFWRADWEDGKPPMDVLSPERQELCGVSIGRAKAFLKKDTSAWIWLPLQEKWEKVSGDRIRPGMQLLLPLSAGGYSSELGWTGDSKDKPEWIGEGAKPPERMADDPNSRNKRFVSLSDHLRDVVRAMQGIQETTANTLQKIPWDALITAARWHDVGKSHPAFQYMLLASVPENGEARGTLWAKSPSKGRPKYRVVGQQYGNQQGERRFFRHELASALAWLAHHPNDSTNTNLIAFLIASHHGKVRGSLRSLPDEAVPSDPATKFARGIWDGDKLPSLALDDGSTMPETLLSLDLMELGGGESGGRSWLSRVLDLRDDSELGPFRLSLLEVFLRIADWRGTAAGDVPHD